LTQRKPLISYSAASSRRCRRWICQTLLTKTERLALALELASLVLSRSSEPKASHPLLPRTDTAAWLTIWATLSCTVWTTNSRHRVPHLDVRSHLRTARSSRPDAQLRRIGVLGLRTRNLFLIRWIDPGSGYAFINLVGEVFPQTSRRTAPAQARACPCGSTLVARPTSMLKIDEFT